ncbi:MAG: hypothetical protein EOP10_35365, partial [Proteobacteria bacterium]
MNEDRRLAIEAFQAKFNDSDFLSLASYSLESLHRYLTSGITSRGVNGVELEILLPSRVTAPYPTLSGQVRGSELITIYEAYREALIASNIRKYKGSTEVNEHIAKTAHEYPEKFFYLNNGLTAYCHRLNQNPRDRGSSERQRITANGFSIVNGAQTLGSLVKGLRRDGARPDECLVPIKLISLAASADDEDFAKAITRSTNYQNTIGPRDFVALQDQQSQIADTLALESVTYHFKDAEDTPV